MIRPKKRYLLFFVVSKETHSSHKVVSEILKITKLFFGEIVSSKMNLRLIHFDEASQTGIIRVLNKYSEQLRASLVLINDINSIETFFYTKRMSGSLKKLNKGIYARSTNEEKPT